MKNKDENKKTINESGSVIVWILVAVGLFAALNFAFNSSSRTSTTLLTDAEAETYANQIIAYGNSVRSAVKRLRLRGFKDTEISFANEIYKRHDGTNLNDTTTNPNCTSDDCNVFSISGGGINPILFEDAGITRTSPPPGGWGVPGHVIFRVMSVEGIGTSASDLTMEVLSLKTEICIKINEIGDSLIDGNLPNDTYDYVPNDGTYPLLADTMGDDSGLSGKFFFCNKQNNNEQEQHFIQVLIAR